METKEQQFRSKQARYSASKGKQHSSKSTINWSKSATINWSQQQQFRSIINGKIIYNNAAEQILHSYTPTANCCQLRKERQQIRCTEKAADQQQIKEISPRFHEAFFSLKWQNHCILLSINITLVQPSCSRSQRIIILLTATHSIQIHSQFSLYFFFMNK